ncbi:MAG: EAL domain-containing protein [Burkholderiaceae bacterium]
MFRNSLTTRIVLLVLAIACAGQLILGLIFVRGMQQRASAAGQGQLDLAERVVIARVAQSRADAQGQADQLARDPVIARAYAQNLGDALVAQIQAALRRAGPSRALLARANGVVVADVPGPAAIAPVRSDYWRGATLAQAFAAGRASGFVAAGGSTVMWTAVPAQFDPNLAIVIVQPIEVFIVAEFARVSVGAQLGLIDAGAAASPASAEPHVRRVFLDGSPAGPIAVELRVPTMSMVALLRESLRLWLPAFVIVDLLSVLAAFALCRLTLRPVAALREAIVAQTPDKLRPLEGPFAKGPLGELVAALNALIGQVRERDQSLLRTAFRDPLTSLPNRALLHERLTLALREARKTHRVLALLLIDIERFDAISDSLGAQVADAVVAAVAARLKSTLRPADKLMDVSAGRESHPALARVAGNRFAIVLPGCNGEQALQVAQRIGDVLRSPIEHEHQEIECSISIGASAFPVHAQDAAGLVRAADIALRWARRSGERIKTFSPEQEREREFHTSMAIDLQKAMANGSLSLRYQPKIALGAGRSAMVEALARWQHPERGVVDPREFVPFAERMGLIGHLSRWAVEQGLTQLVAWRSAEVPVQLSINVSRYDVSSPQFASFVIERLQHHGLPPGALTIEINERALTRHSKEALACLQRLDQAGIKLGIDDFGAGYAALASLRELPVQHVKIDKRFVTQMARDRSAYVIVAAAIRLAHSLQWEAVAEGVEDAETMRMLRELDCDYAQGFYLGKPLQADDYLAWLRHQSRRFAYEAPQVAPQAVPGVSR